MPKFGISKGHYFFDSKDRIISKGLDSVKYMGESVGEELYKVAHEKAYDRFVDVLERLEDTSVNSKQLDILTKLDFFSDFGNQRELLYITDIFSNVFKHGQAKKISKDKIDGTPLDKIVQKYAVGTTKSGSNSKQYTLLDVKSILCESEDAIKALHMDDLSDVDKVKNFADALGYAGYVSGKEADRRKLYVSEVYPVRRKKDNAQFGYCIATKSIGSGKESKFTVFNNIFNKCPIENGDIIFCKSYESSGKYFKLTSYYKIV